MTWQFLLAFKWISSYYITSVVTEGLSDLATLSSKINNLEGPRASSASLLSPNGTMLVQQIHQNPWNDFKGIMQACPVSLRSYIFMIFVLIYSSILCSKHCLTHLLACVCAYFPLCFSYPWCGQRKVDTSLWFLTELCCLCTAYMNCTLFCTLTLYGCFIPRLLSMIITMAQQCFSLFLFFN